jgi:hypothetical protein
MEKLTTTQIIDRLYKIAEETGKPIDEVVRVAKKMLKEEREREKKEAEDLILP